MSRMKKPKKPKGYGGEEFDIHETQASQGLTDDKLEALSPEDRKALKEIGSLPSNREKELEKREACSSSLENFYNQKELKGETLFDNFMSAITTNRKHLWCNYKDKLVRQRLAGIAVNLRSADRFVIAGDLQKSIANVSFEATDEKIFDIINNAIPRLIICGLRQRRTHFRLQWRAVETDTLSKLGGTYNVQEHILKMVLSPKPTKT